MAPCGEKNECAGCVLSKLYLIKHCFARKKSLHIFLFDMSEVAVYEEHPAFPRRRRQGEPGAGGMRAPVGWRCLRLCRMAGPHLFTRAIIGRLCCSYFVSK